MTAALMLMRLVVVIIVTAGYKIVIMSNQKGVDSGKTNLSDVTGRFEQFARDADVPMQLFFCTDDSFYRKPCIGMWHYMVPVS